LSGFRTHHSTSTVLLKITNDLLIVTDERLLSLLVLLDFSKAFDSVDSQFGFTSSLIMSYISNCSQCVQTDDASSAGLLIKPGVIQGSVLGPLLFSMVINYIVHQITSCRVHFYADDV
jgi:hypothetical protein